jgi:hypothetical protein
MPYSNNHIYDLGTQIVDDIRRNSKKKHNRDITVLGTANDSNSIPLLQCFQTEIIKLINDN